MHSLNLTENEPFFLKDQDDHFHFAARIVNWKYSTRPHAWRPPTDVIETEEEIIIRVEVAGMNENDFAVNYEKDILTISGHRLLKQPNGAYHQMEIVYGDFSTTIEIPFPVDAEKISAKYSNGFLQVILPKAKTHTIEIQ